MNLVNASSTSWERSNTGHFLLFGEKAIASKASFSYIICIISFSLLRMGLMNVIIYVIKVIKFLIIVPLLWRVISERSCIVYVGHWRQGIHAHWVDWHFVCSHSWTWSQYVRELLHVMWTAVCKVIFHFSETFVISSLLFEFLYLGEQCVNIWDYGARILVICSRIVLRHYQRLRFDQIHPRKNYWVQLIKVYILILVSLFLAV